MKGQTGINYMKSEYKLFFKKIQFINVNLNIYL